MKLFTKKEPESIKKYITTELLKNEKMSDEDLINNYDQYMNGWILSAKEKKCSSIRRKLREMRQKGEIIETKRINRPCKGAEEFISSEIFFKLG